MPEHITVENHVYSYDQHAASYVMEKRRIGEYASTLVDNGEVIYITGGTTVL